MVSVRLGLPILEEMELLKKDKPPSLVNNGVILREDLDLNLRQMYQNINQFFNQPHLTPLFGPRLQESQMDVPQEADKPAKELIKCAKGIVTALGSFALPQRLEIGMMMPSRFLWTMLIPHFCQKNSSQNERY